MNDRPLTLVLIAIAILVALYIRRKRTETRKFTWFPLFENGVKIGKQRQYSDTILTVPEMKREGELRGVHIDFAEPMTREQFERFLGPVSVK